MRKKFLIFTILLFLSFIMWLFTPFVFAEDGGLGESIQTQTENVAQPIYGSVGMETGNNIFSVYQTVIGIIFSFLGIIFFVQTIMGGYLWMTAGGNDDQISKAKDKIKNGAIGIAIILSAYAVTYFILAKFSGATGVITGFN